jgi:hypothetical protein
MDRDQRSADECKHLPGDSSSSRSSSSKSGSTEPPIVATSRPSIIFNGFLMRSWSAKCLAVRKVTQDNRGKKIAGGT